MEIAQPYLEQMVNQLSMLDEEEQLKPRNLYLYQPAHAEWDVRFGGKAGAKDIARLFRKAREHLAAEGVTDGYYMMALADTLENMDIQLYEHYRVLADLLLEAAQKALPSDDVRVLYAVMKGVRLGLLDPEKYLPAAMRGFERARVLPQDIDYYRLAQDEYGRIG
ncbi:MAG: hypothetical protein IJ157_10450 [Clostridia bacterium]|nr:hypothetical protein [Clostridia bacterium]